MKSCYFKVKRLSFDDDLHGYIGKSITCTPSLVGWAILNQYYQRLSDSQIPQIMPILANRDRRRSND